MKHALAILCMACSSPLLQAASPVLEVLSLERCALPSAEASLRLFDQAASWESFNSSGPAVFSRQPNWQRERVLAITLGSRPTPGYRLSLQAAQLRLGQLQLTLTEQNPLPDALLNQVMTQPCLILLLNKKGWRTLSIFDSQQRPLLRQP